MGFDGNQRLTFTGIAQPWLRDLVKRWLRWRLGTGLGLPFTIAAVKSPPT